MRSWACFLRTGVPVLLALSLVGCAPLVGAAPWLWSVIGALAVASMLWVSAAAPAAAVQPPDTAPIASNTPAATLEAGPPPMPPPCTGTWHRTCVSERIQRECCPAGARCNYRAESFLDCGYDACTPTWDEAECPTREPRTTPAATEADCRGDWARACVSGKVTMACLMPVPTNYTGPPRNPAFVECGDDRCAIGDLPGSCYPKRGEIEDAACRPEIGQLATSLRSACCGG